MALRTYAAIVVLASACQQEHATGNAKREAHETHIDTTPVVGVVTPSIVPQPPADTSIHRVVIGKSPTLGKKDALVTIVEISDFECPFCARTEPTLAAMRSEYGDQLRFVWKNNPLSNHKRALPAAEVALEARDEKGDVAFWKVHDDLFAAPSLDDDALLRIATDAGLDAAKVKAALASSKHHGIIDDDVALARKVHSDSAIPVFFINGRKLEGQQPKESFEALIEDVLASAKARVASGTKPEAVYDAIMRDAVD
jgi:protein-disulfide isomerase